MRNHRRQPRLCARPAEKAAAVQEMTRYFEDLGLYFVPVYTVTTEEAEAVGNVLAKNKTLEVFHLDAEITECSPIVRGLFENKTLKQEELDEVEALTHTFLQNATSSSYRSSTVHSTGIYWYIPVLHFNRSSSAKFQVPNMCWYDTSKLSTKMVKQVFAKCNLHNIFIFCIIESAICPLLMLY